MGYGLWVKGYWVIGYWALSFEFLSRELASEPQVDATVNGKLRAKSQKPYF